MVLRAPPELKGDVVIGVDGDGNAVKYALARDVSPTWPGIAWRAEPGVEDQEGSSERTVAAIWDRGFQGGMGEMVRTSPDSIGYAYAERVDCSSPNFFRLAPTRTTVTPTTAPTDAPTFFFEATSADGTIWIYCINGRYLWKMSVNSSTGVITVETDGRDAGASAAAGRPDLFESEWCLPWGASVDFELLTTVGNAGVADTFVTAGGSMRSLAFATIMDGSTARLARAYSTNLVALAAVDPETAGNWGSAFEVGDSSTAITNMAETGIVLLVAKADNLYIFETPGAATPIFNLGKNTGDSDNGTGLLAIPSTETAFYNHQSGLHLVDGRLIGVVGPDEIPNMEAVPNVTLEPYKGRHYETAVKGKWVWSLYRVTEGATNRTYVLAGYMLRGPQNIIWHPIDIEGSTARGAFIDSRRLLWTQEGGSFVYRQIGRNGSPDAGAANNGRGAAGTQHRLFLSETRFGLPVTLKQLQVVEIETEGVDATSPVQLRVQRDGGVVTGDVGGTITSDGVFQRYYTASTNDNRFRFIVDITTTGAYAPATSDPKVRAVIGRALPRPNKADVIHFVVDAGKEYGDGTHFPESALAIRNRLRTLENGASVSARDPDGNSLTLNISRVADVSVTTDKNGAIIYRIDCWARERITS